MDGEPSSTHVYAIPMRTRFRGVDRREGLLFRGPSGWAEFSPFWDYDDPTCLPWLRAAEEAAYGDWPDPQRTAVPVNVTVPAVGPAQAARIVRDSAGCRTAKVKVAEPGQAFDADLERVEAVRDALGPGGRLRIDANGAWGVDEAVTRVRTLARFDLEYVEQPCRSVDELAAVRRAVDVPVAADESIRRAADPLRVVRAEAADIAVLKVQPLGGVSACLRIAEQIGLPVVVSSAVETSVGIAAGLALAAALPQLPYACGLATIALLSADVVAEPLLAQDGMLSVVRPEPSEAGLAVTAAEPATASAWKERLGRVRALSER
jgi:o-succinylbenzoate synthase